MKKALQFTITTTCILGIFVNSFGQCGVPAPNITSPAAICNYDATPELSATIGDTWTNGTRPAPLLPVQFRYYTDAYTTIPLADNTTGLYTPVIDKTNSGTHNFYVAEYNPNALPQPCEGPRTLVAITVKKVLPLTISNGFDVCAAPEGVNPTFVASDYNASSNIEWHESLPPTPATTGALSTGVNYKPTFMAVGSHTVWAVQRLNGCVSNPVSKSYTIKAIPAPPIAIPASICEGMLNVNISASGTEIRWYQNSNRTGLLVTSTFYRSTLTAANTYTYYATQKVNGCESSTAPVTFEIRPLPAAPVITITPSVICSYDQDPIMSITPEVNATIHWYNSDQSTIQSGGNTLAVDRGEGTEFYASQTVMGCEGPKTKASFIINPKPAYPLVTNQSVCEGETFIPALQTNMSIDNWYADAAATVLLSTGNTYTPLFEDLQKGNNTYYVQREINGCKSDVIPITLQVIPKPIFSVGPDISICTYENVATIQATSFSPVVNANSFVEWNISNGAANFAVDDNALHNITPTSIIKTVGSYVVSGRYRYKYGNIYCSSEIDQMNYVVNAKSMMPISQNIYIHEGDELPQLIAYGSPNIKWKSKNNLPTCYGQGYDFNILGIYQLPIGKYYFDLIDSIYYYNDDNGCRSDTLKNLLFEVMPIGATNSNSITSNIRIFPNPATDMLQIELPNGESKSCTIVLKNQLGIPVLQTDKPSFSVATLPRGIYFCEITTKEERFVVRVVLE